MRFFLSKCMALFFVIALSAPVSANDVVKIGAPSWDSAK